MTKKNNKKKEKDHFYKNKRLLKIDQIDVDKILVLKKESIKYFIKHNDYNVTRALCIKPSQMIRYGKYFDSNKKMYFWY